MVEPTSGPPDPERELEDQQVEDADVRRLLAARALDREGTAFVERVPRRQDQAVGLGRCLRIERPLSQWKCDRPSSPLFRGAGFPR